MKLPKISIITPNYNGAKYLEETIKSVILQNYPNLEYIIIDGASTDESVDIIKRYEKYLSFWISEPDKGLYNALNKGFKKSTGEIMGWINSDDKLQENSLFKISKLFTKNPNVEWIQGQPNAIDNKGNTIIVREHFYHKSLFYLQLYKFDTSNLIQQESTFWKRSLWNKAGSYINEDYKLAGDFELWIRFFRYSKLFNTKKYLGSFRIHENQLSSNIDSYIQEANEIIINELKIISFLKWLKILAIKSLFKIKIQHTKLYQNIEHKYNKSYFIS